MSPNAYLNWNDETRLLEGFQGEELDEQPTYIWNFPDFNEYHEVVTPSMYHFMASYVQDNMTKELLYELQGGDYCPGELEVDAVYAYVDLPLLDRIDLHKHELLNLNAEKARADGKVKAFSEAIPFTVTSPIYTEYNDWVRTGLEKWTHIKEQLEHDIEREEQWRGGHEAGAEDDTHLDVYDHNDEN